MAINAFRLKKMSDRCYLVRRDTAHGTTLQGVFDDEQEAIQKIEDQVKSDIVKHEYSLYVCPRNRIDHCVPISIRQSSNECCIS